LTVRYILRVTLSLALLRQLAEPRPYDALAVEEALVAGLALAAARWPTVELAIDRYAAWIAARIPPGEPLEAALAQLRLADLYLACACAAGDGRALAAFDASMMPRKLESEDLKQRVRQKLFVADPPGGEPRIARYTGRGDLRRWVRAVATRMAIEDSRVRCEVPTESSLLDAIGIGPSYDLELGQVKRESKQLLQIAFRESVDALTARERTLLLQYYIDGVGVVALGKVFDLAPSNISRALGRARVALIGAIRRSLMRHKSIGREELDRMVDLVRSQLSLTGDLRG
jgi:RNA polymerase sigma-70 factor (ECF subfamily)